MDFLELHSVGDVKETFQNGFHFLTLAEKFRTVS